MALTTLLVGTTAAAGSASTDPTASAPATEHKAPTPEQARSWLLLQQMRQTLGGKEYVEQLVKAMQQEVDTFRFVYTAPVHDITGDGDDDVLILDEIMTITYGSEDAGLPGITFDTKLTISARHGKTGRELWNKVLKARDGFVGVIPGKVGAAAKNGFFIVLYEDESTNSNRVVVSAITGSDAKTLWETDFTTTYIEGVNISQDEPTVTGVMDGLRGKASDLLVARTTTIPLPAATIYDTGVSMIDGTDGKRVDHPDRERSIEWWPLPLPAGDQNGDRLDDYTLGNNFGIVMPPTEPGDPDPPIQVGGIMRARLATTGEMIWEIGGLDLGTFWAITYPVGDPFGDRRPELFTWLFDIEFLPLDLPIPIPWPLPIYVGDIFYSERTYVIEGGGSLRFMKNEILMFSPGKINKDDEGDILGVRFPENEDIKIMIDAFSSWGKALWKKSYTAPRPDSVCKNDLCNLGWGLGAGWIGDMHPDHGDDFGLYFYSERAEADRTDIYAVDGLNGKIEHKGHEEMWPLGETLDGHGTDFVDIVDGNQDLDLKAWDGTDASTLWRSNITSDFPSLKKNPFWVTTGELTGDRCIDLLFTVFATEGTFLAIVDGGNGKEIWSENLLGPDREITVTASKDQNRTC